MVLEGWQRRKKNWQLVRDGRMLGLIDFLGDSSDGGRYVARDEKARLLYREALCKDAAMARVELYAGVKDPVPDLDLIGVVEVRVYRVRCGGPCGVLLGDGQEWLDALGALRAARAAGWLTREDVGVPREGRLARCPQCREQTLDVAS